MLAAKQASDDMNRSQDPAVISAWREYFAGLGP